MLIGFDTDLFANLPQPFAAYVEPTGYAEIAHRKIVRRSFYEQYLPLTVNMAYALFSSIRETEKWGKQIVTRNGAQWVTEVRYASYPGRNGMTRPGKRLTDHDLLRALSRTEVYACGRTDQHVREREYDRFRPDLFRATQVDCLCLDVDMDRAWANRDQGVIRHEIAFEHVIANALDLPYRVFRTGGRGHQAVFPLPAPIDRNAASWLMQAYLRILEPFQELHGEAHADATNLDKIVRIVGGRHAINGQLALWINPATGNLYDILDQTSLMIDGYRHPGGGLLDEQGFANATSEIADYLETQLVDRFCSPPSPYREKSFWAVVKALPDNPLVCQFLLADDELGVGSANDRPVSHLKSLTALPLSASPTPLPEWSVPGGIIRWAERQWKVDWVQPDVFWPWISEAEGRGITAAKVLFGDLALDRLIERTHVLDAEMPSKARERRRVIHALYRSHQTKLPTHPHVVVGDLAAEAEALVPVILHAIGLKKPIQARNRADIEHVIRVLLLALQQAENGYIDLSLDAICASIRACWPDSQIDRSMVGRHLSRVKDGNLACGFSLLQEIRMDTSGRNPSARHRPGPDLRVTSWGASLPVASCENARVRTKPLKMRCIGRCGKLTTLEMGIAKRRGRKPTAHTNSETQQ